MRESARYHLAHTISLIPTAAYAGIPQAFSFLANAFPARFALPVDIQKWQI
jgi:hypothetical protein